MAFFLFWRLPLQRSYIFLYPVWWDQVSRCAVVVKLVRYGGTETPTLIIWTVWSPSLQCWAIYGFLCDFWKNKELQRKLLKTLKLLKGMKAKRMKRERWSEHVRKLKPCMWHANLNRSSVFFVLQSFLSHCITSSFPTIVSLI